MKNVLIVGAGRLGKGFVGETFFNAGWHITFLDKDPRVIDELNKTKTYDVTVHTTEEVFTHTISNFDAYLIDDQQSVIDSFLKTDLVMLPLYPVDFEDAAKALAIGFNRQYELDPSAKKTLICLTNRNHIIDRITNYFRDSLANDDVRAWFDQNVVVRDSIVRRSTDAVTAYATHIETTAVSSLIIEGPVYSDFSDVKWLDVRKNVEMLKDIKVFLINGPHATTAYYGHWRGHENIPDAEEDPAVEKLVKGVHDATVQAVLYEYPVTRDDIRELEFLPAAKDEMVDSIFRVAYDPIRKTSPHDRFMGVIDLCLKYDIDYAPITKALATAFVYVESRDPNAVKIQKDIQKNGIRPTVSKYIGRPEDDVVVDRVVNNYKQLQQEPTASVMTPGA